ncbi:hypothetical protein DFH06DRAFT_1319302 [Mycena polygramma]|nr:hypothetical protein DFH06DRAFT_1319302 [Mycena polygramma]
MVVVKKIIDEPASRKDSCPCAQRKGPEDQRSARLSQPSGFDKKFLHSPVSGIEQLLDSFHSAQKDTHTSNKSQGKAMFESNQRQDRRIVVFVGRHARVLPPAKPAHPAHIRSIVWDPKPHSAWTDDESCWGAGQPNMPLQNDRAGALAFARAHALTVALLAHRPRAPESHSPRHFHSSTRKRNITFLPAPAQPASTHAPPPPQDRPA